MAYKLQYYIQGWKKPLLIEIIDEERQYENGVTFVALQETLKSTLEEAKLYLRSTYAADLVEDAEDQENDEES